MKQRILYGTIAAVAAAAFAYDATGRTLGYPFFTQCSE